LIPNAVYEWQLSAKCGTVKPAVFSDYSPIQTFVTLPPRQMFIADTEENDSEENPEDISEVSSNTDSPEISQITDKKESFSKNDNIDELNKNFQTDSEQLAVEYDAFKLKQNYPNPFFDGTVIEYELEVLSDVTLRIYDGAGRLVENALQGQFNQGIYKYTFYSHDNSSGFYVAVLSCNGFSKTMNMRLIK
jgi:hypothetical protein